MTSIQLSLPLIDHWVFKRSHNQHWLNSYCWPVSRCWPMSAFSTICVSCYFQSRHCGRSPLACHTDRPILIFSGAVQGQEHTPPPPATHAPMKPERFCRQVRRGRTKQFIRFKPRKTRSIWGTDGLEVWGLNDVFSPLLRYLRLLLQFFLGNGKRKVLPLGIVEATETGNEFVERNVTGMTAVLRPLIFTPSHGRLVDLVVAACFVRFINSYFSDSGTLLLFSLLSYVTMPQLALQLASPLLVRKVKFDIPLNVNRGKLWDLCELVGAKKGWTAVEARWNLTKLVENKWEEESAAFYNLEQLRPYWTDQSGNRHWEILQDNMTLQLVIDNPGSSQPQGSSQPVQRVDSRKRNASEIDVDVQLQKIYDDIRLMKETQLGFNQDLRELAPYATVVDEMAANYRADREADLIADSERDNKLQRLEDMVKDRQPGMDDAGERDMRLERLEMRVENCEKDLMDIETGEREIIPLQNMRGQVESLLS